MNGDIERRTIDAVELRFAADEPAKLVGHAALFNNVSPDLGGFRERIKPGAFTDSLANDDIRALFNHDPNWLLGRSSAGTLRLSLDSVGLRYEIDPPETQQGKTVTILCPIVRAFIDRNPEYADLIDDQRPGVRIAGHHTQG